MRIYSCLVLAGSLAVGGNAAAQGGRDSTPARPGGPRPYDRVITSEAKSKAGLFTTHRVGERLYYEIPAKENGKEMLIVRRLARAPAGSNLYGGNQQGDRVVRWERIGNRVFLRGVT